MSLECLADQMDPERVFGPWGLNLYRNENIRKRLVEVKAVEICHVAMGAPYWPSIAADQRRTKEGGAETFPNIRMRIEGRWPNYMSSIRT
jgi:hypothetical protein